MQFVSAVKAERVTKGPLNQLTAVELGQAIACGTTCEQIVRACLDRVDAREKDIRAWACLDREHALSQARALDRSGARNRPLFGIPIAVKDVIETADLPTQMGSPLYEAYRPASDAATVGLAREAGAVILGKTVTCEFAGMTPGITTNPHNVAHTPGGSSSGSAAAVADFMVPLALGTQTGGSVLRPASFCGVFGFKPTFGAFNRRGLFPAAESLDTIGIFARSIADIELLNTVLELGAAKPASPLNSPPRIGLCRTPMWQKAEPETVAALEGAAEGVERAGALIKQVTLPASFSGLRHAARETINNYERAAAMAHEWNANPQAISPRLRERIELGRSMPRSEYLEALRLGEECRAELRAVFADVDVLLAPCVNGEAPHGLASTGDPSFQTIWTILHTPALSLPTHRGPNGLPVGIQLVAPRDADRQLLACAHWVWGKIGPSL
jgi:Asp-tRNA(Asn)/Glu-tRNA(Gln) amidotransferase A subunit family amidase